MSHPYKELPAHHFWRDSISAVEKFDIDPAVNSKFRIRPTDKIVTIGSCFAQHLSKALEKNGFKYLVTEAGLGLSEEERLKRNYGVYSARYGNVYTARQFRQLLEEAFGEGEPFEKVWVDPGTGKYIDPYRPNIEPMGFNCESSLRESRRIMLKAVRKMVREGDVLVYTLGLTEAWMSKLDGWVFPVVPGAAGGAFDEDRHCFVNFRINEVMEDLSEALGRVKRINERMKVILTVSPVPLIATFENRSVLTSTVYSKSVLRVAAEEMAKSHDWVQYFPSFEVIAGAPTFSSYYASDLRQVRRSGVSHVMRLVMEHLVEKEASEEVGGKGDFVSPSWSEVVCDEEAIDRSE